LQIANYVTVMDHGGGKNMWSTYSKHGNKTVVRAQNDTSNTAYIN